MHRRLLVHLSAKVNRTVEAVSLTDFTSVEPQTSELKQKDYPTMEYRRNKYSPLASPVRYGCHVSALPLPCLTRHIITPQVNSPKRSKLSHRDIIL